MIGKTKFPSFQPLFCEKSTEDDNKPTADPKAETKRPRLFAFQPNILGNGGFMAREYKHFTHSFVSYCIYLFFIID